MIDSTTMETEPLKSAGMIDTRVTRRELLRTGAGACLGCAALAVGGAAYMSYGEPAWFEVVETTLALNALDVALEGFRIVFVSDLHTGPHMTVERFSRVVELINAQVPHLVIFGGDYVTAEASNIKPYIGLFGQISAAYGSLAVLGNHDVWTNPDYISDSLESVGVSVLRNQQITIPIQKHHLMVTGLLDSGYVTRQRSELGSLWAPTLATLPELPLPTRGITSLFIAHNPDVNELLGEQRIDLALSGHTHGGQIRLPFGGGPIYLPSCMGMKYAGGLANSPVGRVYVTRGLGVSGPPIRLNCRPEISLLKLTGTKA